jgi:lipoprotein-anchoring transpeptidase ErfK/SrfK
MERGMRIRKTAASGGLGLVIFLLSILLSGCMQGSVEPASNANFTPRDQKLLAFPPYRQAVIPQQFQRQIVDYDRKDAPGTILIDPDARYLYYVLPEGKAIRYGVTVGEEAHAWSGVAKIGRKAEWPAWVPTAGERETFNAPKRVAPGPANPMGARALYLYQGNKDTLYRIHGTNQPEYIGHAVSTGCIRLTNENVIDLYSRAKVGTRVIVLPLGKGNSSPNPRVASGFNLFQ